MSSELQCGENQSQVNKSHASHAGETSGTQFLEELESRHKHVLDELDALNTRIEQVLKLYVEGRQEKVT